MAKHLKIMARPDARQEKVTKRAADQLEIAVRQPAAGGAANRRILELLRERFPGSAIKLVKGHHSAHKIVSISEQRSPVGNR